MAGRQKRSRLGDLFIGSTTNQIIRKAAVPILVTKYHTITEIEGEVVERFCVNLFQKILYAVDWSPSTERAEEYLPLLRQLGASEIIIVHIADDLVKRSTFRTDETQEPIEVRTEKLRSLERELQTKGFQAKAYLLEEGSPYQAINRIATEEDVSLIIMGSGGKGFVEGILGGSVYSTRGQAQRKACSCSEIRAVGQNKVVLDRVGHPRRQIFTRDGAHGKLSGSVIQRSERIPVPRVTSRVPWDYSWYTPSRLRLASPPRK